MKLYELSEEYARILDAIEMADGEVTEDEMAMLDALGGALENKIENVAKLIKSTEADADGYDKELKRLSARKRTAENRVGWLKGYILTVMTDADMKKVKGATLAVGRQKNPPSCVMNCEAEDLPKKYQIKVPATVKADKKLLLQNLKDGAEVTDVEFINDKYHIRIR